MFFSSPACLNHPISGLFQIFLQTFRSWIFQILLPIMSLSPSPQKISLCHPIFLTISKTHCHPFKNFSHSALFQILYLSFFPINLCGFFGNSKSLKKIFQKTFLKQKISNHLLFRSNFTQHLTFFPSLPQKMKTIFISIKILKIFSHLFCHYSSILRLISINFLLLLTPFHLFISINFRPLPMILPLPLFHFFFYSLIQYLFSFIISTMKIHQNLSLPILHLHHQSPFFLFSFIYLLIFQGLGISFYAWQPSTGEYFLFFSPGLKI